MIHATMRKKSLFVGKNPLRRKKSSSSEKILLNGKNPLHRKKNWRPCQRRNGIRNQCRAEEYSECLHNSTVCVDRQRKSTRVEEKDLAEEQMALCIHGELIKNSYYTLYPLRTWSEPFPYCFCCYCYDKCFHLVSFIPHILWLSRIFSASFILPRRSLSLLLPISV